MHSMVVLPLLFSFTLNLIQGLWIGRCQAWFLGQSVERYRGLLVCIFVYLVDFLETLHTYTCSCCCELSGIGNQFYRTGEIACINVHIWPPVLIANLWLWSCTLLHPPVTLPPYPPLLLDFIQRPRLVALSSFSWLWKAGQLATTIR